MQAGIWYLTCRNCGHEWQRLPGQIDECPRCHGGSQTAAGISEREMIKEKARRGTLTDDEIRAHQCDFGIAETSATCSICGISMADIANAEHSFDIWHLRLVRYRELRERKKQQGASSTAAKHDRGHREIETE